MGDYAYAEALKGLGRVSRFLGWQKPLVLSLHSVTPADVAGSVSDLSVSAAFLELLILDCRSRGIDLLSLDAALARLADRRTDPFLCLTFDDGYRDIYEQAFPVLLRHTVPFAVFLTTGLIDRVTPMWWHALERLFTTTDAFVEPDGSHHDLRDGQHRARLRTSYNRKFRLLPPVEQAGLLETLGRRNQALDLGLAYDAALDWPMVNEMAASGLAEFGCHTMHHPMLSQLDGRTLAAEVTGSRDRVGEMTGRKPKYFAYPFGMPDEVGRDAASAVKAAGFAAAFSTRPRCLAPASLHAPFDIPRVVLARKAQHPLIISAYGSDVPGRLRSRRDGLRPPAHRPDGSRPVVFSLVVASEGKGGQFLADLFRSLERQTFRAFEVIVVDQNADDRLVPIVETFSPRIPIRRIASPRGLSRARNAGLAVATGVVVAFPDDDCWYPDGLLAEVSDRFAGNPALAGITGRCTDAQGYPAAGADRRLPGAVTRWNVWDCGVSASMFLQRDVFRRIGGFDEALGLGAGTAFQSGEETDILLRAVAAGFALRYDPSLVVHHPRPDPAASGACSKAWRYGLGAGRVLRKHRAGPMMIARSLTRPILGTILALVTGRRAKAQVRWARTLARFHGWRWSGDTHGPRWCPAWIAAEPSRPRIAPEPQRR